MGKSRVLQALRLVWIVCLAVQALPTRPDYGLGEFASGGGGPHADEPGADSRQPQQNFPEPMMDFYNCGLNQTCLESYGWPARHPHAEYTVRAMIGNVSRNGSNLLAAFSLSVTDPGRSAMQLRFFKDALPKDNASTLYPDLMGVDEINYTLLVETEQNGSILFEPIEDITVPVESLFESGWIMFSAKNISALFSKRILDEEDKITFQVQLSVESLSQTLSCVRNRRDPLALEFLRIKHDSRNGLINQLPVLNTEKIHLERAKRREARECDTTLTKEDLLLGCHLEELLIPFSDVGYTEIFPPSYDAKFCTGPCRYPIPEGQAELHTQVQAFMASQHDSNISFPTCVPTNYTSAYALLKGEWGVYDIVVFENVTASECGCR